MRPPRLPQEPAQSPEGSRAVLNGGGSAYRRAWLQQTGGTGQPGTAAELLREGALSPVGLGNAQGPSPTNHVANLPTEPPPPQPLRTRHDRPLRFYPAPRGEEPPPRAKAQHPLSQAPPPKQRERGSHFPQDKVPRSSGWPQGPASQLRLLTCDTHKAWLSGLCTHHMVPSAQNTPKTSSFSLDEMPWRAEPLAPPSWEPLHVAATEKKGGRGVSPGRARAGWTGNRQSSAIRTLAAKPAWEGWPRAVTAAPVSPGHRGRSRATMGSKPARDKVKPEPRGHRQPASLSRPPRTGHRQPQPKVRGWGSPRGSPVPCGSSEPVTGRKHAHSCTRPTPSHGNKAARPCSWGSV